MRFDRRFSPGHRNRGVRDDSLGAGKRPDRVNRVGGERDPLGKPVCRLLRGLECLVAADDHVGGCIALRVDSTSRAGFDQHSQARGEHGGGEDGHEDADERTLLLADAGPDEGVHHLPDSAMRSMIRWVDAPASEPTNAPSARKTTRSARDATAGSCVTMTMV